MNGITAWSWSRLDTYEQCPARFKYKFISKLPDPPNEAMKRGSEVHAIGEKYMKMGGRVPKEFSLVKDHMKTLRKDGAKNTLIVEGSYGFTSDWEPTEWFAKDTWLRCKVDVACIYNGTSALAVDYKTGQFRGDRNFEQLELYAIPLFLTNPMLQTVRTQLWYVDSGNVLSDAKYSYTREFVPGAIKKWTKRAMPMFKDRRFTPNPSDKCRWCPFSKSNSGPCKF